jgi:signal transduction histidine kinase
MSKILVVDDDAHLREAIADALTAAGHAVQVAENGRQGVAAALAIPPDLVLCDVVMPDLDGFGVVAQLRHDPRTALVPFVFLTAVADASALRTGMDLGADDYLVKPVSTEQLLRTIDARLARDARRREEAQRRIEDLRSAIARSLPHEFLTPLTAVIGLASFVADADTPLENVAIRDVARGIAEAGLLLQELIERFLFYAELEATSQDPAAPVSPVGTAGSDVTEQVAAEQARRLGREDDLLSELETVQLSLPQAHLRALVRELADNAFKFSEPGTPVSIRLRRTAESRAHLTVTDEGRGMAAEEVARVAPFVQFERRRFEQPGMGLGLALVQRIVALAGGETAIESAPGRGTTVRLSLPALTV